MLRLNSASTLREIEGLIFLKILVLFTPLEASREKPLEQKLLTGFSEGMVRAISSAGLERFPYKEDVTGSTPVSPTINKV